MKYIDEREIKNKKVLLRVDYNVSFTPTHTIVDDLRIKQSLQTIKKLLDDNNKLIIISHQDNPTSRDTEHSLKSVAEKLQSYLPSHKIIFIDDFLTDKNLLAQQTTDQIVFLENIRFYPGEKNNDREFAQQLASLAEVYVNEAFSVSHRNDASIVSVPQLLPSYGGLLLRKEIETIIKLIENPVKPFVAIIGGVKISTKIHLLTTLIEKTDSLLVGGALANTFLAAQGYSVGQSFYESNEVDHAKNLLQLAQEKQTNLLFPSDVVLSSGTVVKVTQVPSHEAIEDIGPETQQCFSEIISQAETILWNGPMGKFETSGKEKGTQTVYHAIAQNNHAQSLIGGGDTMAAIAHHEHPSSIIHVSTGGGAMLSLIEHGTLPGIEALKNCPFVS